MNSNYPPGAANDPRAPYNERPLKEVDVTVKTSLIKETVVETSEEHYVCETEIEPDGSRATVGFYETDEDLKETFLNAHRSAIQIIRDCEKICRELAKNGIRFYAGIFLPTLIDDSQNWEEEETVVSE
jgi:hypothetical protein